MTAETPTMGCEGYSRLKPRPPTTICSPTLILITHFEEGFIVTSYFTEKVRGEVLWRKTAS
jgi:hypothetical protein